MSSHVQERADGAAVVRNPVVDAARVVALLVVVLWHWALSVTFRGEDGRLVMANPIDNIPGSWALTWVLQVVPVFFLVGGYAHAHSWLARRAGGESAAGVLRRRLRRLAVPFAVWAGGWLVYELLATLVVGAHRPAWVEFPGLVTPLWFLGVYLPLVALVPVLVSMQERHGVSAFVALVALVAAGGVLARVTGLAPVGWAAAGLVWLFVFQLGVAWRVCRLEAAPRAVALGLVAAGLGALGLLTTIGGYPRSMVATAGAESNLAPTSPAIAALAVGQLGLLLLAAPYAARVQLRPVLARLLTGLTAVALTVYLWHMTAYVLVVVGYEALGGRLLAQPDGSWWAQRPLWLLAPLGVLAGLVLLLRRIEAAARTGAGQPSPTWVVPNISTRRRTS